MAAERRKRLLDAARDAEAFIKLGKDMPFGGQDCEEVLQSMSSDDCLCVWNALIQHIAPDFEAESQATLEAIEAICGFGCAYLKTVTRHIPASMQSMVQMLHDSLLRVEFESDVQDDMSRFCEAWYLADTESRRYVVPQTILYLLLHSVGEKGKQADVKRVYAMREALLCIEIGGESFQSVQESLLRAAIHPTYVMHDDGRRFLSFILSIQPQLTRLLHKTIKSQLPRCRKSMLVQYGELYHSAWKRASGPVLHTIEHDCLQDLAAHAINAASPSLASAIRHVMSVFHSKKKFKAVDEMLARIYEPILWRAFSVANASVRVQAAQLLAEAFPVQDPEASAKDLEEGLNRQIRILHALLKDGVPRVREVGVECVCRVLSVYLELLPLHTTTGLLGLLIKQLALDAAAAAVRMAVLRGLAIVLDNHVSHPLLAPRLPLLADRIHDSSEGVRVCMADLLLKVRGVKGIRFFDVVPLPDILARLAADEGRPAVARRLTRLLMPSYMPLNKPSGERLARILALAQQHKEAAQVLLREAAREVPPDEGVKLVSLMRHALARHAGLKVDATQESPLKHKSKASVGDESQGNETAEALLLCSAALAQKLHERIEELKEVAHERDEALELSKALLSALPGEDKWLERLVGPGATVQVSVQARCAVWRLKALALDPVRASSMGNAEMEECLVLAWRNGGALEMQAVMECFLAGPACSDSAVEGRGKVCKQIVMPLAAKVRLWLQHVEACLAKPPISSSASAQHGEGTKQRRTGKNKATGGSSRAADGEEAGDQAGAREVLERIKALMTCSSVRKRLLAVPSCLLPLVKALSGVVPVLERRIRAAAGHAQGGINDEALGQALELYLSLLVHVHCAQFPGEVGTGKAAEGMQEVVKVAVACFPIATCEEEAKSEQMRLWHVIASRLLLLVGDSLALNRCDAALAQSVAELLEKAVDAELAAALCLEQESEEGGSSAWWPASLLQATAKASFQLLRIGMEKQRVAALLGLLLENLPKERIRLVGQVIAELLRVASLEAPDAKVGVCELSHVDCLRQAVGDLVRCCLRRLEAFDTCTEQDAPPHDRPEEAAARLVNAAASVGGEALILVAQELCLELEASAAAATAGTSGSGETGRAGGEAEQASKGDLSRVDAALSMAQAMAATRRAHASALDGQHEKGRAPGMLGLTHALTKVVAALRDHAHKFAPGKRQLQPAAVAQRAERCLSCISGSLAGGKPSLQAVVAV